MFTMISRKQAEFTKEHQEKIVDTVKQWRKGTGYKDIPGFCCSASLEEIEQNNHVLTPGRYVGVQEEEDDGVPFEEKMKHTDLEKQMQDEEKMNRNIKKQLGKVDYKNCLLYTSPSPRD